MARIRALKIGFFRNEDLCVFSFAHRLLFEGLWVLADRDGRLEDRPRRIHADIFPFDSSLDVDAMLSDLAGGELPFIERYEVDGRRYIQVVNFSKHQRPHKAEPKSVIPVSGHADSLHPPSSAGENPLDDGDQLEGMGNGEWDLGNGEREGRTQIVLVAVATPPEALGDAWNAGVSAPIPHVRELTDKRRRGAVARLRERVIEDWRVVIGRINASPFCRGENERGWVATFDWLLQPDTAVKVLEGKYDARKKHGGHKPLTHQVKSAGVDPDVRELCDSALLKESDIGGFFVGAQLEHEGTGWVLRVPNADDAEWIQKHYLAALQGACVRHGISAIAVRAA